jgi:putative phosphoserine phosphatase/1-acylglycerol-3-phosphate O-acyltransferase
MRPLAEFVRAEELVATQLDERDGVFTGELIGPPVADEHKAVWVRAYAERHAIDLAQSFAYGNNVGDAAMLECVGRAVAVNPDGRLRALAGKRGWPVVAWGLR